MLPETPPTIHLSDYQPTPYRIDSIALDISLHPTETRVLSKIAVTPRASDHPLVFHGEGLKLVGVWVDGMPTGVAQYEVDDDTFSLHAPPQKPFTIEIEQTCNPQENTKLSGLYLSNGMFCTQMEAEGFRRFAYMYDRPDIMAPYRVRIEASKSLPILLSNGNRTGQGDIPGTDRHFAVWHDPHPKPSYLFALVGGDLASVHDTFTTMSGRQVTLGIYVEKGKEDRCDWAMESLKTSMRWDETRFGREYDLEEFNIVAVSDFNMGAMENKGLNIFNDKYILARPDTATDMDYINIEAIIAHEYFHNWTGNRITCREWFQLCLKEGLTVFRDQEFTSDVRSRAVKRIQDVKTLRARQFPEDQGPLSHPARPNSYIEINNFYTPTVYEKGAEICRMMHTLIGDVTFRKGMDLYFERHDGQAATVEDFVRCMADASGRDLSEFFKWYEQAGTPLVNVTTRHDAKTQNYDVTITQSTPSTPGQDHKAPLHMPIVLGLLGEDGLDLPLHLEGVGALNSPMIEFNEAVQSFRFTGIKKRPVLSINRQYSAPIVLQSDATDSDLLFQMGHDNDSFNRWEAAQTLGRAAIVGMIRGKTDVRRLDGFAIALAQTLSSRTLDNAFKALMLTLPPEAEIAASLGSDADADKVVAVRESVRRHIARIIAPELLAAFESTRVIGSYRPDTEGTSRRSLRYAALSLIAAGDPTLALSLAAAELAAPDNMTAEIGALNAILTIDDSKREEMLDSFYQRHKDDHLLIDKWLMLNAQIPGSNAHLRVEALLKHKDFSYHTPNRVYALIGGFSGGNLSGFNAAHGEGYRVVADTIIKLNSLNPQVASRMSTGFRSWKIYDEERRNHAKIQMERILAVEGTFARCF